MDDSGYGDSGVTTILLQHRTLMLGLIDGAVSTTDVTPYTQRWFRTSTTLEYEEVLKLPK
ncbi:hypothetical protein J6590_016777 [Homalodisca vitripennis]|nr:hypothetical protein J6590_016777 [Homalodisca vitripennis]